MNKCLLVALLTTLTIPFALSAQTKLEDNLKAVMLLFDKSRKESEARIQELTQANEAMTASIAKLESDLANAETRVEELQSENMLLRSKISEVAVSELETAALTMTTDMPVATKAKKTQAKSQKAEESAEPIPDFTPAAFKKAGTGNNAEPLSEATVLLVNINSATDRELRMLPGVGPQMSQRIIENRPFASIWDLMKLQGMGKSRIESLQVYITVE